jgi:GDPmannose 4,6-dehydratase
LDHLYHDPKVYGRSLFFHYGDLEDTTTLRRLLLATKPDEIYHLAGQSHVALSFEIPESTCETTAMAALRLLEVVRDLPGSPRFFHASSSEVFGHPVTKPQEETTPFAPITPYGVAKAFATQMVTIYRQSFGLFACNGILFNHESPRRGENFVTRKICRGAVAIKLGLQQELLLGDLDMQRDWGHSRDYVRGMWLTLQHSQPEDFVFATGQLHRVQDVVEAAFGYLQLDWHLYVRQESRLLRPAEPVGLVGNAAKAKSVLQWTPTTSFNAMIQEMTQADWNALQGGRA